MNRKMKLMALLSLAILVGISGSAYGEAFLNSEHNFQAIENLSDNGFTNSTEIATRTFLGDQASNAVVPVPEGQQVFPAYVGPDVPEVNQDPSLGKPIAFGPVVIGGENLDLQVNTGTYSGPVDIYFAIGAPSITPELYILTPTGLQPFSTAGLVKWKSNVSGANESPFGLIPASLLPSATLNFFLAITPAGSVSTFYLYQTSFTKGSDVQITTILSGSQEVPSINTPGIGSANLTVNLSTGAISGSLTFSGLTSNAVAAHIHQAPAGTNGTVILSLTGGEGATSGTFTIPAGSVLTPDQITSLMADGLYFNVHSLNFGGGEIRGQIDFP